MQRRAPQVPLAAPRQPQAGQPRRAETPGPNPVMHVRTHVHTYTRMKVHGGAARGKHRRSKIPRGKTSHACMPLPPPPPRQHTCRRHRCRQRRLLRLLLCTLRSCLSAAAAAAVVAAAKAAALCRAVPAAAGHGPAFCCHALVTPARTAPHVPAAAAATIPGCLGW